MAKPKPAEIQLTIRQKEVLEKIQKRNKAPSDQKLRAHIILLSNQGIFNTKIAEELGIQRKTASKWRNRWAEAQASLNAFDQGGVNKRELIKRIEEILKDKKRSGHPSTFTAEQTTKIFALACQSPEDSGLPISHWTSRDLANEAIKQGIVDTISASYVCKLLRKADLKPYRIKYWETPPSTRSH